MDLNNEEIIYSSEKCKITKGEYNGKQCIKKTGSFSHEAVNAIARINSPYIPHIYEIGDDYITSEYVDGADLSKSEISPKNVLSIALELCGALAELHKNSVIHRDIKPSNIILCGDGHIKLIDFDAARIKKIAADKDTAFIGTDGFAPPEQFGFTQTDERSDIYSFGVTIKLLLGESYARSVYRRVVRKCTRFDPEQRYQSISAVKSALIRGKYFRFAVPVAAALGAVAIAFAVSLFASSKPPSGIVSAPENSTPNSSTPELISGENNTEHFTGSGEITWDMLALPNGFPRLSDALFEYSVSPDDYEESAICKLQYNFTWEKMNDAEFDEVRDKIKTWLGTSDDGVFSEDSTTETYVISTDRYNVSLKKDFSAQRLLPHIYGTSEDHFAVRVIVDELGDNLELPNCGFDFADPSAEKIGERPLRWEDTMLNGKLPKLSDNVTDVEESDGHYTITWSKMTFGEIGSILREITDWIGTSQCSQGFKPTRDMKWEFSNGSNHTVLNCDLLSNGIFYDVKLYVSFDE